MNSRADLNRHVVVFFLQGWEYLNFNFGLNLASYSLDEILGSHLEMAEVLLKTMKHLKHFKDYIVVGYYPFFKDDEVFYYHKLQSIANMVIEIELPPYCDVVPTKTIKLKQLLYIIAHTVPFKLNINKLAASVGISRNILVEYIKHLVDTGLLNMLNTDAIGIGALQKPDMLYLENTNLSFAFAKEHTEIGNLRETLFLNQVSQNHVLTYPKKGDLLVDNKLLFELERKDKRVK